MRVNKTISLLLLLAVLVSALQILPDAPSVKADVIGTSLKRAFTDYYGCSPQLYAQKADMYICHIEVAQTGKVQKIHQLRPDMICLLYRNMRTIKTDSSEYQMFLDNGWLMKDANGTIIRDTIYNGVIADKGNPAYQKWVGNWIKSYLNQYGFDGAYADRNLYNTIFWGFWGTTVTSGETGSPVNPRTGQTYTNAEFFADQLALIKTVKNTIYPKLLICNGVINGNRFYTAGLADMLRKAQIDGVVSEYLFSNDEYAKWYSETSWKQSVDYVVWLENNFLGNNKVLLAGMSHANNPTLPPGCTQDQYITFTFASLFLAATNFTQYYSLLADGSTYGMQDYPQSLFNLDLGSPLNAYYVVSGSHVYTRDFTKAKILVNPTSQPYQVTLTGGYTMLNGTAATSPLTLNPNTGLVLVKSLQNTVSARARVMLAFGSVPGSMEWDPKADMNSDSRVDILDAVIAANMRGDVGLVHGNGTVKYMTLEGGFYAIFGDDGGNFDPINLPQQFKVDGLRVHFTASITDGYSFHMWGYLIVLFSIEQLS